MTAPALPGGPTQALLPDWPFCSGSGLWIPGMAALRNDHVLVLGGHARVSATPIGVRDVDGLDGRGDAGCRRCVQDPAGHAMMRPRPAVVAGGLG